LTRLIIIILCLILADLFPWTVFSISQSKAVHLFFIERDKNKNTVQYDLRLTEKSDPFDSSLVDAYWILGDGRREELSLVEKH